MSVDNPRMRRTTKRFMIGKRHFVLVPAKQTKWTYHTMRPVDGKPVSNEEFAIYVRTFSHMVHIK